MLDSEEPKGPEAGAIHAESGADPDPDRGRLEGWLGAVDAVEPGSWRRLTEGDDLPPHVRAESEHWCDLVLRPAANPHGKGGVTRDRRAGEGRSPDLIRQVYAADGLDITLFEGRNFLLVAVARRSLDLLALPEAERPAAVARAAEALFREPLRFDHCAPLADGSLFCTDAASDPLLLASWAQRAEGYVREGALWFVCYKRHGQQVGFANPAQWFSDDNLTRPAPRPRRRR